MKRLNYLCLVGLLFASAASAARGESIEWVRQLGTVSYDQSTGVSADGLGYVYFSGNTYEGNLGGPPAGSYDAFVAKISDPAVPEPPTLLLASAALGLCIARRRRRARNDNPNAASMSCCIQRLNIVLALSVCIAALVGLEAQSARADSAVAWGNYPGDGSGSSGTPVPVSGMDSGVTAIAAGGPHILAVQNGAVYAWGRNDAGQLGDGTRTTRPTPVPVSGLASDVAAVAAGGFNQQVGHSLAVQHGAAYAWGTNSSGQLGNGFPGTQTTPVPVSGMEGGVTAVAAGGFHSLAVQNGGLYAWGANGNGQLGDGTSDNRTMPTAVIGLSSGVTAISAGNSHSLAVKDGGVYSWGSNQFGQLGNGSVGGLLNYTPELVAGLESGATAVAAGDVYSVAAVNGSLYAWGQYTGGTPVQVDPTNVSNIIAVAAQKSTSVGFALSSDGSLWTWSSQYPLIPPGHMFPPSGYKFTSIAAGFNHVVATMAAIPEPSTFALGALAFAALLLPRRAVGSRERRTRIIANHDLSGLAEMSVD